MKAKGLLITLIFLLTLAVLPFLLNPENEYLSVCPSKLLFGTRCPVCGMGRSFAHITKGEINKALYFNKSALVFYPLLLIAVYLVFVNFFYYNTQKKLPGYKLIAFLTRRVIPVAFILLGVLILFFAYDLLTGSGEAVFDYKYTIWYMLSK